MNLRILIFCLVLGVGCALSPCAVVCRGAAASNPGDYEGRTIAGIEIVFEGSPGDAAAEAEFLTLLHVAVGGEYSAVAVRESLDELFKSGRVANARVEVIETGAASSGAQTARPVSLRFIIKRQPRVADVVLDLGITAGTSISEDELRGRLNMLEPGARVTDSALKSNADLIQAYLRDKGFYGAEVDFTTQLDASGTRASIVYHVRPGVQARVKDFTIDIKGFNAASVRPTLVLQPGTPFTRAALSDDLAKIRRAIIALGYLAPQLDDTQVSLDSAANQITIKVTGGVGPKVEVVLPPDLKIKEKEALSLLPIKREGNIDESAIVEGERRLRNRLQGDGYFFAQVEASCSVTPPLATEETQNGTQEMCRALNAADLTDHTVNVTYNVERGRRFKLTDIRLEGTDKLSIADVSDELRTQKANAFGIIPYLGYGRGITSNEALDEDRRLIESRMRDLGYRHATASVRQGVSLAGENLIITFVVNEGPLTRITGVEVRGNQIYTEAQLRNELQTVTGAPFSRSQARADADRMLNLYARNGYIDAQLDFSIVALPDKILPDGKHEEEVRVVYTVRNEGDKVFINRIVVNGDVLTKREAIVKAIPLKEGEVLRADQIAEAERVLYATDAFRQVIIRTEPAGETASGFKRRDVIIDVEELKPRILGYGGGFSTDNGPLGFVDLRNVNLFGQLRQGALRVRGSRRQQTLRLEYFDPRFRSYGAGQFAPLTISAEYTRDSSITRFFRSTIDKGAFGIVQRLDEHGNPIDAFGKPASVPTINRFTFNIETQRVVNSQTRSILFLRYSYEDVRLFHLNSLLIQPILQPDRAVRLSRFGAAFVRDTRERCGENSSRVLQFNTSNGQPPRCEYSSTDATNGDYLSLDYSLALRQLGGNISFNKLQATYRRYYQIHRLRGTVLAGNLTLGLANVFNARDRDGNGVIDEADETLPISERFFAGGSTSLRGFGYEEAGPRLVICPGERNLVVTGGRCAAATFRKTNGDAVDLNPFTVPLGGNALAVLNLEARVPLTKAFQVVPFYDGGNIFRRIGDLFGRSRPQGGDTTAANLRSHWANTVGLGLRIKTPIGGALSIDYGYLLNPPEFLIPQGDFSTAIFRLRRTQLHFRFTQSF
ncbi:MAG TPA: POTRA domain-containing protein [Pyrinomonadaceae bacterium]